MDFENNKVKISGMVCSGFTFSHEVFGEGFYIMTVAVKRKSESVDIIPVMVSDRLVDIEKNYSGMHVEISGQFRSFNRQEGEKRRLVLSVFAREIGFKEECGDFDLNDISLTGYICKQPAYRQTPLGREITDVVLAVNRPYRKSDYIPCIVWGRNARFAEALPVGTCVEIFGRIQSREYRKKISENEFETRTAYEVSVSRIEKVEECANEE